MRQPTLHIGAKDAILRLREAAAKRGKSNALTIRFLTNTSTKSVASFLNHLNDASILVFGIDETELIASLKAILVQTGKYRKSDEEKWRNKSSMGTGQEFLVRPSIVEAIDYILEILERDQQEE